MNKMKNTKTFILVLTGILGGFPALITDSYLPSFPELMNYFNTNASNIQMSLMSTMIGIALGQLIIGPLSDKFGRKIPLLVSLCLFILASFGLIYSTNISIFILLRLLQGLSSSSGVVLSRAILTDSFKGEDLSKSLSINSAIVGFTPTLAPIIGGLILSFSVWQGVFIFLLIFGISILLFVTKFEESLPINRRKKNSPLKTFGNFVIVLKNRDYVLYVLIFSFAMGVMFAYIASSPFIFQNHYSLSPFLFSLFFGMNAFALVVGAIISGKISDQVKALRIGVTGLVVMSLFAVFSLIFSLPLALFEMSLFSMFIFNGIIYPSSTTLALQNNTEHAGTASSIHGAMSFLIGGIVSPLAGIGNILISTSILLVGCALITLLLLILLKNSYETNFYLTEEREVDAY